jgi:hypothetical protein
MMMMPGNHKKMAELIVAGIPNSKSAASQNEKAFDGQVNAGSDEVTDGQLEASRALLSAFKGSDPHRLALALKDAFALFDADESEPDTDSEDASEESEE